MASVVYDQAPKPVASPQVLDKTQPFCLLVTSSKKQVRTFASLDGSATNKSWQHPMSTRTQGACPSAQNAGTFSGGLLFIISLFVSGCVALPLLIPPIIEWGADLLVTAVQNYDTSYKEDLQVLLLVVQDPIASHGETPYSDNHPQPNTEPISLDVLLAKKHVDKGVPSYLPIRDGDILRDGRGDPQAGDKFRIMFRAKTQCYVYVIAIDGSAWAQGVFPPPGNAFANPVKPGQQVILPEGPNWFSLDQYQGIETIFFVASQERRPDLEKILTKISGRERHPSEKPAAVTKPAIIPRGFSVAKASRSPFAIQTSQGQKQELIPTTFLVQTAGEALRVTRWFHHQ
jgi:hypothetical protein